LHRPQDCGRGTHTRFGVDFGKAFKPLNHKQRDEEIENNGSLTDIYKHYRRLKDMSREARYNIASFADRDLEIAAG
jgi:hypothetical protein